MAIKLLALAMMDAGGGQMRDPPHGEKYSQQQPIEPCEVFNQARLQVPTTALAILKGRLDTHASGILTHALATCRQIRDQEPGFFVSLVPDGTELRLDRLLILPEQHASKPLLSFFQHEVAQRCPRSPALAQPTTARMLFAHPQQVMKLAISTQLHQRCSCQSSISDQRTISRLQVRLDLIEQVAYQRPLTLVPFLLPGHPPPPHPHHPPRPHQPPDHHP